MSEQYQCLDCGRWVLPGQADHDACAFDDQRENFEEWLKLKLTSAFAIDPALLKEKE